ncbi:MAG: Ca2+-dependent phosphoinositide-specific phospholipase C, partial [Bacillota bacterium]
MTKRPGIKIIFKIVFIALIIIVISSSITYIVAAINMNKDIDIQTERVNNNFHDEIDSINEQDLSSFDLSLNPPINRVQTIATHNSYKKKMPWFFYGTTRIISSVFDVGASYQYAHNTLINQLNNGIRGMEFDIRYQKEEFYIYHNALFDQRTHNPKWSYSLKELLAWSEENPEHTMINILIELKTEKKIFNPYRKKLTDDMLMELSNSVIDILGEDKVLTPKDWQKDYDNLNQMVASDDWLTYEETKGKFVFLLHPNSEYTRKYINLDLTLDTLNIVPMINSDNVMDFEDWSAFILDNTPSEFTKGLVDDNYFVRTRMDSGAIFDSQRFQNAVWSGAQI